MTSPPDIDDDRDSRAGAYYDRDDDIVLRHGRAATPAEQGAIASLVKQYYAAAASANGAAGCHLVYSLFAEAIAEDYGEGPGPLHGMTCTEVLSKMFKLKQRQWAKELPAVKVVGARIEGKLGWAVINLGPKQAPRRIRIRLDGETWKIRQLETLIMP